MEELGIQLIFALSPQAKGRVGRVERMAETFQDRLVTELRLASASTIGEANEILQESLSRFNAQFAVAAEHSETAYRPVSAELSLYETISLRHSLKVGRDNTVKYHWRLLQLVPGADRPSYAGLPVEVLERADGKLMIRYSGETVYFQESLQPLSALWAAAGPCSNGPKLQKVAAGPANGHFNGAQRKLLAALETADEEEAEVKGVAVKGGRGTGKPVRHSLHRTPTPTQQARLETVQRAKEKGLSLRAIARSSVCPATPPESTHWPRAGHQTTQCQGVRQAREATRREPSRAPEPRRDLSDRAVPTVPTRYTATRGCCFTASGGKPGRAEAGAVCSYLETPIPLDFNPDGAIWRWRLAPCGMTVPA